jgi:Cu(I)/Ag(I) efflux system membrane protein CusA/SilA
MPMMWSLGSGADMMKRVAAPMIGGLVTSFILELLVYPPIYEFWKWNFEMKRGTVDPSRLPIPELHGH